MCDGIGGRFVLYEGIFGIIKFLKFGWGVIGLWREYVIVGFLDV